MKKLLVFLTLLFTLLLLASYSLTAQASAPAQGSVFSTPTPLPDGRIIYIVQAGDSCFRISALTGISIDELRTLNRLGEDCLLNPGQELLLGIGGPSGEVAPPAEAEATPTVSALPTATPPPLGEAKICVILYNDINGDALRQDTEPLLAGGALNISGASGQFRETVTTPGGEDPLCFERVPESSYNISVAAPDGYNPTTQLDYTLAVHAGEQIEITFGAQEAAASLSPESDEPGAGGSSSLLGILGIILLLAGLGLGAFAWRVYGRKPKYNQ